LTRSTRTGELPRGLGVDEETVRRWDERQLIRTHPLPIGARPIDSSELAAVRHGFLTGFPEPREEELPTIRVRGFVEE
jgi:hypothetical protein